MGPNLKRVNGMNKDRYLLCTTNEGFLQEDFLRIFESLDKAESFSDFLLTTS